MSLPNWLHCLDKHLFCKGCEKTITIKHNQVGGYWHLSGWTNKYGVTFHGGYCSPCFDKLHDQRR